MSFHFNLIKTIANQYDDSVTGLVEEVFIDSRKQVKNGLFIPIIGERFDGHDFINQAIDNGAVATLWDEKIPLPNNITNKVAVFLVGDTLVALQQLAKQYLKEVQPTVIGVTGSNGKTTTKDLLEAVLKQSFRTHKTAGNYNNHIGMPLTILAMTNDCEVIILEMGMNHSGEISFLSTLAEPDIAIITNIGESHIEQLGSREGIAKAKLEIVDGLKENGVLIIDGDEPLINGNFFANTVKCGYNNDNDRQITDFLLKEQGAQFVINNESSYSISLLGKHNIKNSLYAVAVGKYLGLSNHKISIGLQTCQLTSMRMESKQGINGATIINDAYNSSPTSMVAAIETVKQLPGFSKKILVLGDMYELGSNEQKLHRSVAEAIDFPITNVITIGSKGKWISEALIERPKDKLVVKHFDLKEEVTDYIKEILTTESLVLVKASRGMKLETVAIDLYC